MSILEDTNPLIDKSAIISTTLRENDNSLPDVLVSEQQSFEDERLDSMYLKSMRESEVSDNSFVKEDDKDD